MRKGSKGSGVPRRPVKFKILSEEHPELCLEWDKENIYSPSLYSSGSSKKVWWKCRVCGYRWLTEIRVRHQGCGCPKCAKGKHISRLELRVYAELKQHFPDTQYCVKKEKTEIDVFIPSLLVGIEIDGVRWHQSREKDQRKNDKLSKLGIKLIRLRQELPIISSDDIVYKRREDETDILFKLLEKLNCKKEILGNMYYLELLADFRRVHPESTLIFSHPKLSQEWSDKNFPLLPKHISHGSEEKVWWKCQNGHEWEARINSRSRGRGCPICQGKVGRTVKDTTLISEWSDKNSQAPDRVLVSLHQKYFWYCKEHNIHYLCSPNAKYYDKTRCPICRGEWPKLEDSVFSCEKIMKFWDHDKNKDIDPKTLKTGSVKKVWFKNSEGISKLYDIRSVFLRQSDL